MPNPKEWNTEREFDDLAQTGYVVITRRRDRASPTIEKAVSLHASPESSHEALDRITKEVGDYYEVREVMIFMGEPNERS